MRKKINIFIFVFLLILNSKESFSNEKKIEKIVSSCLEIADVSIANPEIDLKKFKRFDIETSKEKCEEAYKVNPNSIEITRSLARIYIRIKNYEKALAFYHTAANNKDPYSQYSLGVIYSNGLIIKKDISKSLNFYKLSASQNYAPAQYNLAKHYEEGLIVTKDQNQAFKYYQLAMKQNFTPAYGELARFYYNGWSVKKDIIKAKELFKVAAERGDALSQYNLGYLLLYDFKTTSYVGDPRALTKWINLNMAVQFLEEAADNGIHEANVHLHLIYTHRLKELISCQYCKSKILKKPYERLTKLMSKGKRWAKLYLALLHLQPIHDDIPVNHTKSFYFLKTLSNQGSVLAKHYLAHMYYNGYGTKQSDKKAAELYEITSNLEFPFSQFKLATMKFRGEGVKKDIREALKLFNLAASQGLSQALIEIEKIYKANPKLRYIKLDFKYLEPTTRIRSLNFLKTNNNLSLLQFNLAEYYLANPTIKNNVELAIQYYNKSASNGNLNSFAELGWKYHQGIGVPKNVKKAYEYYIKAGKETHALDRLGTLFREGGEGFNVNFKKAIQYYKEAIKLDPNNPYPYYHLGKMYYSGHGFSDNNIQKAIELYELSAEKGSLKAAEALSEIYNVGIGVPKNIQKALYWIERIKDIPEYEKENLSKMGYFNIEAIRDLKLKTLKHKINNFENSNNGQFYALMIGISKYDNFITLKTPLNDTQEIGKILKKKYGFQIIYLKNPNKKDITNQLFEIEKKLKKKDSLLIYFAGHGKVKNKNDGYWIPKDAHKEDDATWISNDYIVKKLKSIKANNIVVIADSCFSGTIGMRGGKIDNEEKKSESFYLKTKSRIAITSGANQPVLDGGAGQHSIFARLLINRLDNNKKPIVTSQLYGSISDEVKELTEKFNVKQTPERIPLYDAGHVAPDFVFIPK